jgi:hypothetical protein
MDENGKSGKSLNPIYHSGDSECKSFGKWREKVLNPLVASLFALTFSGSR